MKLNPNTKECTGNVLIFGDSLKEPTVAPVTIQVDELYWKPFELIDYGRKRLVEEFRGAYGQAGLDSLRGILDHIDMCILTIAAYRHCPEEQVQASTSNLSAVVDRLNKAISMDLPSLIINAEIELQEKTNRLRVPLCLIAYTNPIMYYALNSASYMLTMQDSEIACLKMANDD